MSGGVATSLTISIDSTPEKSSDASTCQASSHAAHLPSEFLALAGFVVRVDGARMITDWRATAIRLYFRCFGSRCILCSKPVLIRAAALLERDGELFLFHNRCARKAEKNQ